MHDQRKAIATALKNFADQPRAEASRGLFAALGYSGSRTIRLSGVSDFLDTFDPAGELRSRPKAFVNEWRSVDLLFQLTDDDLSGDGNLFTATDIDKGLMRSYLFFHIALKRDAYAADQAKRKKRVFLSEWKTKLDSRNKLCLDVNTRLVVFIAASRTRGRRRRFSRARRSNTWRRTGRPSRLRTPHGGVAHLLQIGPPSLQGRKHALAEEGERPDGGKALPQFHQASVDALRECPHPRAGRSIARFVLE